LVGAARPSRRPIIGGERSRSRDPSFDPWSSDHPRQRFPSPGDRRGTEASPGQGPTVGPTRRTGPRGIHAPGGSSPSAAPVRKPETPVRLNQLFVRRGQTVPR
jgi:hypothetical protein